MNSNKYILYENIINDGSVTSCFDFNSGIEKDNINYCKYLLSTSEVIVALGVDWGNYVAIQHALDNGKQIYMHKSSLIHKRARELYHQGCPVISSIEEIAEFNTIGTLFSNVKGEYKYLEEGYSFLRY